MLSSITSRWATTAIAAVFVALGAFLTVTALGVGRHHAQPVASAPYTLTPFATYEARAPHVLSTTVVNSAQGAVQGAGATPPSVLPPLPASAFNGPTAQYRAYAVGQLGLMESQVKHLESALAANDRTGAQEAWRAVYVRYLRLGAVYLVGPLATLNQAIDGNAGGLPGGTASPQFAGLHRIEYGLWTSAQPRTLLSQARQLNLNVRRLRGVLGKVSIEPLEYATRAHEILEDAARDLLSGADVPWSQEGVLATNAGLQATEEVIATLRPLLMGRENTIPIVKTELAALRSVIASLAAAHGGSLPSNTQLTQAQAELLDGTLGGTLEALSQVPGSLETELPQQIPQIPKHDARIAP
ncbi:MAG TPA: EfeM/EfeO family lipoprotein [Solirubrobacteraceae bacterium]|jgi:iron uptake system EfeUOB component EfeO/EfeM|nr:EfeM/EfeO family lipoprotein [Solirubrobacteraceae bacterium]